MEDSLSMKERTNSTLSWTEMTLFALALGVISGALVYLFDVFAIPLISGPRFAESTQEVPLSIIFGAATCVGVLLWAGVGSYLDEHFPELRDDPSKKKTTLVALTLGGIGTLLLYLFDTSALPLMGADSLSAEWEQPVIAWILIGILLFDVALYWGGVRRVVEEKFSSFRSGGA
jgi:hypothetical protein